MATVNLAQPNRLNPSALTLADAARLLTAAGGQLVTAEMIQADVDAGAPTSADGTINLIHYAAWLVRHAVVRSSESAGATAKRTTDADRNGLQTPDYGLTHGA